MNGKIAELERGRDGQEAEKMSTIRRLRSSRAEEGRLENALAIVREQIRQDEVRLEDCQLNIASADKDLGRLHVRKKEFHSFSQQPARRSMLQELSIPAIQKLFESFGVQYQECVLGMPFVEKRKILFALQNLGMAQHPSLLQSNTTLSIPRDDDIMGYKIIKLLRLKSKEESIGGDDGRHGPQHLGSRRSVQQQQQQQQNYVASPGPRPLPPSAQRNHGSDPTMGQIAVYGYGGRFHPQQQQLSLPQHQHRLAAPGAQVLLRRPQVQPYQGSQVAQQWTQQQAASTAPLSPSLLSPSLAGMSDSSGNGQQHLAAAPLQTTAWANSESFAVQQHGPTLHHQHSSPVSPSRQHYPTMNHHPHPLPGGASATPLRQGLGNPGATMTKVSASLQQLGLPAALPEPSATPFNSQQQYPAADNPLAGEPPVAPVAASQTTHAAVPCNRQQQYPAENNHPRAGEPPVAPVAASQTKNAAVPFNRQQRCPAGNNHPVPPVAAPQTTLQQLHPATLPTTPAPHTVAAVGPLLSSAVYTPPPPLAGTEAFSPLRASGTKRERSPEAPMPAVTGVFEDEVSPPPSKKMK